MKVQFPSHRITQFVAVALAALALSACSGSQQDEEELDVEGENQQANLGNDDAAEGNGQENYTNNNNGGNQQYQQGAEVNNATEEEEEFTEDNPTLNGGEQVADVPIENAPVDAAPVEAAPMNAAPMNAAPMNAAAPANAALAPAPASTTAESPVPGGRVRYVREGGVQVMNAPNGTPVQTLDQGEHPVTWEENGWLRITNGMYVPADAMSDKGVPRPQSGTVWTN